eukprot:750919-Rhodomonas_salina.2
MLCLGDEHSNSGLLSIFLGSRTASHQARADSKPQHMPGKCVAVLSILLDPTRPGAQTFELRTNFRRVRRSIPFCTVRALGARSTNPGSNVCAKRLRKAFAQRHARLMKKRTTVTVGVRYGATNVCTTNSRGPTT